jgi:hypothetical protein
MAEQNPVSVVTEWLALLRAGLSAKDYAGHMEMIAGNVQLPAVPGFDVPGDVEHFNLKIHAATANRIMPMIANDIECHPEQDGDPYWCRTQQRLLSDAGTQPYQIIPTIRL